MNKKMSSVSLSVVEKMKRRTEELKQQQNQYNSKIDYSQFNLNEKDTEQMKIYEKNAIFHGKEIIKNNMELSKIFYEAQKTLSKYGKGSFGKWFESLGFKRTFVYMCLKRNSLFLEYKNEKIFNIPEKTLNEISKIKEKISNNEIIEILNSEKPMDTVKSLSGNRINESTELEKLQKEIKLLEKKLKELKLLEKKLINNI
ncbi:hypothetical protein SAMN02745174_01909 [Cetobacterium ceti]|uniref:DUF3102 domain-containing protein n=1 Tax=Cetobacterium ceti TaxID=180163 RepID=A0A1T4PGF6_9FUSO|nr:hypothetical protein [Cetobacterium ceti]SJZ90579.1 hypothetical protein SAMN02745174_01909 [Cetobacterium ceti]